MSDTPQLSDVLVYLDTAQAAVITDPLNLGPAWGNLNKQTLQSERLRLTMALRSSVPPTLQGCCDGSPCRDEVSDDSVRLPAPARPSP